MDRPPSSPDIAPPVRPVAAGDARPGDQTLQAHDRVYRTLRAQIMSGEIGPGQALTLRGLGRRFGVSMTPAREAVQRLVAEGALSMSSSGRVTTPDLSPDRIEELAAIRALLEPELASRALPRAHMALI
ncbi:MAG: GntR family transcriptional regulator, partial [Rhodobacteraceae bacterium]|nr:GntR family transcriptional regulator [Paracoccaceae bacterium]